MSDKTQPESPLEILTDDVSRQRWSWVQQAISSAKHNNASELYNSEAVGASPLTAAPLADA
ncbi:MAG: hypothetical protein AAF385_07670 [Pseudomonadota bacterium]